MRDRPRSREGGVENPITTNQSSDPIEGSVPELLRNVLSERAPKERTRPGPDQTEDTTDAESGSSDVDDSRTISIQRNPLSDPSSPRRNVLRALAGVGILAVGGVSATTVGSATPGGGQALREHVARHQLPPAPSVTDVGTDRRVDAVNDLGLDPTGGEPIQNAVESAIADGVEIGFPSGSYRLSAPIIAPGTSNFALVGEGDVAFVVDSGITDYVVQYQNCRSCGFVGIDLDQSASDCSANLRFRCHDGLVVSDVAFVGVSDPSDSQKKIHARITSDGGAGRIERLRATDGTEVGRPGVDHNAVHKQRFDGGAFVGPAHEGTLYFLDCEIANWSDNGLFASRTNGGVVVDGGYYANSSISQVRLGHPESFVGGGVRIEVDPDLIPEQNNPDGLRIPRGIWIESGSTNDGGATVGAVEMRYAAGAPRAPGKITIREPGTRLEGPVSIRSGVDNVPPVHSHTNAVHERAGAVSVTDDDGRSLR